MPSIAASASLTVRSSACAKSSCSTTRIIRTAPARKDKTMRLECQQCRGYALARYRNAQIFIVGCHTAVRPRIVDDHDVARLITRAPSAEVGVHRAFDLKINEELVGTAHDRRERARHVERRALRAHQDRLGHSIGAGGKTEARFLRRIR